MVRQHYLSCVAGHSAYGLEVLSGGVVYLLVGGLKEILFAIQNMIADISGLICDGAKSGCALKIASSLASLGSAGMKKTDQVILDMMIAK